MKDFSLATPKEQKDFFDSFDYVLSDVDGVLWLFLESIPGTQDAIKSLKQIGKKVVFVSNNCTKTIDFFHKQLTSGGFDVEQDDIIYPTHAMVSYFRKLNFTKEVFVLGTIALKKELERGGIKVADSGPQRIEETLPSFVKNTVVDDENIGAVIADGDVNLTYVRLQRAATYLRRPEVIFITGATDVKLPIGLNRLLIGPGYFHKILEDITGRTPIALAKPSPLLNDYIVEKLKITDRSRVLFIGDSIPEDMGFAAHCGYKKLLVLSGLTRKESIASWTYPEEYKPDYYVDSLKSVHDAISNIFSNNNKL